MLEPIPGSMGEPTWVVTSSQGWHMGRAFWLLTCCETSAHHSTTMLPFLSFLQHQNKSIDLILTFTQIQIQIFLQALLNLHVRVRMERDHKTSTFNWVTHLYLMSSESTPRVNASLPSSPSFRCLTAKLQSGHFIKLEHGTNLSIHKLLQIPSTFDCFGVNKYYMACPQGF